MAKIGTAQVEIKPVLNEDALTALCTLIEQRISAAVRRAMQSAINPPPPSTFNNYPITVTSPTVSMSTADAMSADEAARHIAARITQASKTA